MRVLEFVTGHVIYNSAYTYKFQLKTTQMSIPFNKLPSGQVAAEFESQIIKQVFKLGQ